MVNVYSTSAQVTWYIAQVRFGFETYYVEYGPSMDALDMQSQTIIGGPEENATYSVTLENLLPLTTYYYRVRATNIVGSTPSDVDMFTTRKVIVYHVLLPVNVASHAPHILRSGCYDYISDDHIHYHYSICSAN